LKCTGMKGENDIVGGGSGSWKGTRGGLGGKGGRFLEKEKRKQGLASKNHARAE